MNSHGVGARPAQACMTVYHVKEEKKGSANEQMADLVNLKNLM